AGFLRWLDPRLFEHFPPTIRTVRRLFQNAVTHLRIRSGNTVENPIKRDFGAFLVAVFARFDQVYMLQMKKRSDKQVETQISEVMGLLGKTQCGSAEEGVGEKGIR